MSSKDQQNDHTKVRYIIDKCWIDKLYIMSMHGISLKMEGIVSVTAADTAPLSAL